MKKIFISVLGVVAAFSMCATTAFAAGPRCGRNFVDADGDGLCDNINGVCSYVNSDGSGICDVCGTSFIGCLTGNGMEFADADGDGVCDNCGVYHWCGMAGAGCGVNFVDEDNDGICDNYVPEQGGSCRYNSRRGCGNGFRGGCCR